VTLLGTALDRLPARVRDKPSTHREMITFAVVGAMAFAVDTVVFFTLKSTVLRSTPVTAKIIATLLATIGSYVLNRRLSFRRRGGRATHHEAVLFT